VDRDKFLREQAEQATAKFSLTSGEAPAREQFLQLATNTYDFLISAGAPRVWAFDPADGLGDVAVQDRDGSRIELSEELKQRWQSWKREYIALRARNARLEIRDLMQHISETLDGLGAFWDSLRDRELARDAGQPMAATRETRSSKAPVDDPLFALFIARVRRTDDLLKPHEIIIEITNEVRRELGMKVGGWFWVKPEGT
jgi:hypothetical protein